MAQEDTTTSADTEGLDDLTKKLIGWYKDDIKHVSEWRKEAREDFEFYSGDQWSKEDKEKLAEQMRPAMVFNDIAPLVNAVVGSEINNRREVRYIPREMGDAQANEVLTAAGEWFRDQTAAEDEESDAFEDAVICGMGFVDTRLDFEEEPDGTPKITRLDPLKMAWDCNACKPNLEDARRLWYVDEKPLAEAREMFPDVAPEMLNAAWAKTLGNDQEEPHDQQQADFYNGENGTTEGDKPQMCTIVECRWFEKEPFYRGPDINTGEPREYSEPQVKMLQQKVPGFRAVRQYRKVVKRAFIGRMVLATPDQPLVPPGLFGWEAITGYRDKIKGQFYGVVRTAKDPQRWSNKFFSQVMHLLNSQSKGGIMAERGAFEDDADAETSWAKADGITYLAKNALAAGKIKEKPVAQFPAGFFSLFQESKEAITRVTGLSPEFIGTRAVDQPGVLEYQRRQSSLNLLASLFNALRRYRKRQGKVMLYLIQHYLSDGRLVRIVGKDEEQYVPLTKESVASSTYDIIIDDAPNSPNEKERTWQILQSMLPLVKDMVTPDVMLEILPYTPLPASFVDKLVKSAKEKMAQPQPPTPEEIKAQADQRRAQLDIAKKGADVQAAQAKHQMDQQSNAIDLWVQQQQAALKMQVANQKAALDAQKIALQERQAQVQAQRADAQQTNAASGPRR